MHPKVFSLKQNYPNPFNPTTNIEYHLPGVANVELIIFDIQGHVVRQLVNGIISSGYHTIEWDSKDTAACVVASGMYFYRIKMKAKDTGQQAYIDVKKMILMK